MCFVTTKLSAVHSLILDLLHLDSVDFYTLEVFPLQTYGVFVSSFNGVLGACSICQDGCLFVYKLDITYHQLVNRYFVLSEHQAVGNGDPLPANMNVYSIRTIDQHKV